MSLLKKCLVLGAVVAVLAAGAAAGGYRWAMSPVALSAPVVDVTIKPHSSVRGVAHQLVRGGVPVASEPFILMTRVLGLQSRLKSGNYEFKSGITPYEVLQKLALGDTNEDVVTIIEGWSVKHMRAEIDADPSLTHDTLGMTDAQLLAAIGATQKDLASAEGLFFPDTYLFDKGSSDLGVYRRAYRMMELQLTRVWNERPPGLPYQTPYELLTMASLIEKETGKPTDRPLVAAVFLNRLRLGMPLQTDPSVIYGMGDAYTGHLHKRDLQVDTPYNTYTRRGMPPTPIALPGAASLEAATRPAQTGALYFVSRGDGTSVFSDTLGDHNKAVDKYIRGQP